MIIVWALMFILFSIVALYIEIRKKFLYSIIKESRAELTFTCCETDQNIDQLRKELIALQDTKYIDEQDATMKKDHLLYKQQIIKKYSDIRNHLQENYKRKITDLNNSMTYNKYNIGKKFFISSIKKSLRNE